MNYIKELNGFRNWLMSNQLPAGTIALWHALMSINNTTGWKRRFSAPNGIVGQLSGLSRQGISNAREQLIDSGLIHCDKGRRGKAPVYEMISFEKGSEVYLEKSVTAPEVGHDVSCDQVVEKGASAMAGFYKNEKTGARRTMLDSSVDVSVAGDFTVLKHKQKEKGRGDAIRLYEENIGRVSPVIYEEIGVWLNRFGEEVVMEAMRRAIKYGGRTFRYVERILLGWLEAGVETVDDVLKQDDEMKGDRVTRKDKGDVLMERTTRGTGQSVFDLVREEVGV